MKITVHSIGLTPHEPLQEFLEKKLNKLDTFYDKIQACEVFLKVENSNSKENKTAEIILNIPGDDIVVKKTAASFEESIDLCVDVAKKLLIKKKEKEVKYFSLFLKKYLVVLKNFAIFAQQKRQIEVLLIFASIAQLARARDL